MIIERISAAVEVYSRLPRYREILGVLHKYGFGEMLKLVSLQSSLKIKNDEVLQAEDVIQNKSAAERFRLALEELGPTFVKFGQVLSSRRDLVDEALFLELHKLQAKVPPFPGKEAVRIIEEQLGRPIDELFREFDETPIASASLSQVHRAVARGGAVLAIKVQRPDIAEVINQDLAILADVARFLEKHVEAIAALNPVGVVEEFSKTIYDEQDFTREARNMERFANQFHNNRTIRVPAVYRELSTEKVLTMEYISGYAIDDPSALRKHQIDPVKLADRLAKLIYQQMFQFGYFHADPHPGNMTVLKGEIIALYDYGMMGKLAPSFREKIASMIMGLNEKDNRQVTRSLLGMSDEHFVENMEKLEADVEAFTEEHVSGPLKDLRIGFILNRLLEVLMKHKLRMKADFYLGIKALSQVEAIGVVLSPDLNFINIGKPYATEVLEKKWSFHDLLHNASAALEVTVDVLKTLPFDLQELYQKVRSGKYSIPIEHKINPQGYEPLRQTLNHITNRMAHAIVLSSLLILSGLLFVSNVPPRWHDIPVFAIICVGIAGFTWLRQRWSIHKHGGL
ncbi:MAG: AarF/ABC1/UbiB kinase family protein [Verrucomicrobiia bacterium]